MDYSLVTLNYARFLVDLFPHSPPPRDRFGTSYGMASPLLCSSWPEIEDGAQGWMSERKFSIRYGVVSDWSSYGVTEWLIIMCQTKLYVFVISWPLSIDFFQLNHIMGALDLLGGFLLRSLWHRANPMCSDWGTHHTSETPPSPWTSIVRGICSSRFCVFVASLKVREEETALGIFFYKWPPPQNECALSVVVVVRRILSTRD